MRRLLIIILLVAISLAGGGWWLWQRAQTSGVLYEPPAATINFPKGEDRPGTSRSTSSATLILPDLSSGPLQTASNRPVVGVMSFGSASSSLEIYAEAVSGHLYLAGGGRLSNTTIAGLRRIVGASQGKNIKLLLTTQTGTMPETLLATFIPPKENANSFVDNIESETALQTQTLSRLIREPVISPTGDAWAYLTPKGTKTEVVINQFSSSSPISLYSSPLEEWILDWPATSTITLQTKPASFISGTLIGLNPKTKVATRLIGGVSGLSANLSPDGQAIVYSGAATNGIFLGLYYPATDLLTRAPFITLADKCTWSKDSQTLYCAVPKTIPTGNYPEDWYQSNVNFSDIFWKFDRRTNRAEIIYNPELANPSRSLDAANLVVSVDESKLYFKNKADQLLWSLNLKTGF